MQQNDNNFIMDSFDFFRIVRPKDFQYSYKEGRKKHGFIFVQNGQANFDFPACQDQPQMSISLLMGEVVFIPKGCMYDITYVTSNTQVFIAQFEVVQGNLPEELNAPCKIPNCPLTINKEFNFLSAPSNYQIYWQAFKMYELIWNSILCLRKIPFKFKSLKPAIIELQENFHEQKTVSYYAQLCHMSESNFRKLFREYTGFSTVEYRNNIRLNQAWKLIQIEGYTVESAANAVGFFNISYFCRSFRKYFGHTPMGK